MELILLGLLGVVVSIVIGTFWHMPKTWGGKIHMKYIGFDKLTKEEQHKKIEEAKPNMWKTYLMQAGLSFLTSIFIVYIVKMQAGMSMWVILSEIAGIWLCFTIPTVGGALLWGAECDVKLKRSKFVSDAIYNLLTYIVIAVVVSWFV